MRMKRISDRICYYPHQPETDRPMLAYVKGKKVSLAIDAGNSADHVDEFYEALSSEGLKKPDFTVITHWHWDHTFGLHHVHGISIAHRKTNDFLNNERTKIAIDNNYIKFLRNDDECFAKEYSDNKKVVVVLSDLQFEKEITLNLGDLTANIFHVTSPHSEDSVIIHIPEEKVLFLGDATSEDYFNDSYMDKNKLKVLIDVIENIDCQYCILSHAEPLIKSDLLYYLKNL